MMSLWARLLFSLRRGFPSHDGETQSKRAEGRRQDKRWASFIEDQLTRQDGVLGRFASRAKPRRSGSGTDEADRR